MSTTELHWNELARYFAGEGSEEERQRFERYIEANEERRRLVQELQVIWDTAEVPRDDVVDVDDCEADLRMLLERIRAEQNRPRALGHAPRRRRRPARPRTKSWTQKPVGQLLSIVLLLVFVAGSAIAVLQYTAGAEQEAPEPTFREVVTERAQRASINLADGTRMILGADSRVRIPDEFGEQTREIHLEGEVYFDVERAPDRPFIVHTRQTEVVVTGTAFGVAAYPEDEDERVVVEEGSVTIRSPGQPEGVNLEAGQMGIIEGALEHARIEDIDAEAYLSWTGGELVFDDMRLPDAIRRLERWYDVDITLEDQSLSDRRISAILKTQSVPDMVHVIATTLNVQYQIQEDKIVLMR